MRLMPKPPDLRIAIARYRKPDTLPKHLTAEMNLIGLNELKKMDRWELERRSRALAEPLYVGKQIALCRIMGRYKFYVATDDFGFGAHILMDGLWESWLTVFMARIIKPGMCVVDAGANHGYYTMMFADLVGQTGHVAAIEPHPVTAALLKRNVDVNGFSSRVQLFDSALSKADGEELSFMMPENEPKNARLTGAAYGQTPGTTKVLSARLDTLLAPWPRVDFIKIDVEGAEETALEGAWPLLERDRPMLLLEFNPSRCQDPGGLLDRLEGLYGRIYAVGFESDLTPISRDDLMDTQNQEDRILFLSK